MKRHTSLSSSISRPASRRRTEEEEVLEQSNEEEALVDQADKEIEEPVLEQAELADEGEEEVLEQSDEVEEVLSSVAEQEENCGRATSSTAGDCNCCREDKAIQPTDKTTLSLFVRNRHKFFTFLVQ